MKQDGLILVTGASGKTGRRCIAQLIEKGSAVRGLVRRQDAARELEAAGVRDVVIGDMFAPDVIDAALAGASQVLHICPPMHPREDELALEMIARARTAGVAHFVMWSVLHPHVDVPHHRRKQKAEAALIESGLAFTILQPGRYMQHLETVWKTVRDDGVHAFPFSTKKLFSLVHLDDLAAAAAIVLTAPSHANAIYELAGPQALSQEDCAQIIAQALGRPVRAQAAPLEASLDKARAAGVPDWRVETLRAMNEHYDAHGLEGNGNVLRWLLGRAPKTFADHVAELNRP